MWRWEAERIYSLFQGEWKSNEPHGVSALTQTVWLWSGASALFYLGFFALSCLHTDPLHPLCYGWGETGSGKLAHFLNIKLLLTFQNHRFWRKERLKIKVENVRNIFMLCFFQFAKYHTKLLLSLIQSQRRNNRNPK